MKRLLIFACLLTLIFNMIMSCNEDRKTVLADNAETGSLTPDFGSLKSSGFNKEEELIRLMADYVWYVRENLVKSDRTYSLTENELSALRDAPNDRELNRAISSVGGNGGAIVRSFPDYRHLSESVEDQNLDVERISKLVARKITEKVYQNRFGAAKMPDCEGLCRQQLNIDIESCENELALEIGATLVAGAISVGMVSAGGFIFAVGTYFNCESTAFASFDICSTNCGVD